MPKNVVLILGESFNKHHSSLYNYDKNTNPRLDSINDSLIYTFKNIVSATVGTNITYQCILNTYNLEYGDSVKWYTCTSLQEILSLCGYSSYWISNQNEKGFYDVVATRQAELCDEKYFTKNKFHGDKFSDTYDEDVLPLIKEVIEKQNLNFYFVHLLGSHPNFKKRYPEQFNHFTCKDYLDKPEHQRQTLAYYDNSILYNDYVISEIIKLFEDKETVIIYVPDHGLDIFQTNDDYCGHVIIGNEESFKYAREIPFIIYTSTLYANNNPNIIEKIRNNTEKNYNTVNLIYTIMDILGIRFKENNDVEKYSLFAN
jgi:heptose-I-phosphate ethanolaminephosphotransferase